MKKIKLSRKFQNRNRLGRGLVSSLLLYEKVLTTETKARMLKQETERVVSRLNTAKDDLLLMRYLKANLYGGAVKKAFDNKGQFASVSTVKLFQRHGDGTRMCQVVLNRVEKKSKNSQKESKPAESKKVK